MELFCYWNTCQAGQCRSQGICRPLAIRVRPASGVARVSVTPLLYVLDRPVPQLGYLPPPCYTCQAGQRRNQGICHPLAIRVRPASAVARVSAAPLLYVLDWPVPQLGYLPPPCYTCQAGQCRSQGICHLLAIRIRPASGVARVSAAPLLYVLDRPVPQLGYLPPPFYTCQAGQGRSQGICRVHAIRVRPPSGVGRVSAIPLLYVLGRPVAQLGYLPPPCYTCQTGQWRSQGICHRLAIRVRPV